MQESSKIGEYNLTDGCKVHLIVKKDDTNIHQQTSNRPFSTVHANISATLASPISESTSSRSSPCSMNSTSGGIINNSSNYNNDNALSVTAKCAPDLLSPKASVTNDQGQSSAIIQAPNRFEVILRERLAKHFDAEAVEKIMANIQLEIDADINSSSLDDLERMAKQKLNISNE